MNTKLLLLSCFIVCISCEANANNGKNENTRRNEISGSVYNTERRKPISNVSVTAYYASKKEMVVFSDNNGNYAFDGLKSGTYKLVFERDGFKKVTKEKVLIKTDEGFQLNVEMNEKKDFDFVPGAFGL